MNRILFLCALLMFGGCCAGLKDSVKEHDAGMAQRDAEISALRERVSSQEEALKAKDAEIQELKNKLRNFGVF
ncbi:MAG: hypothetical protein ACM3OC_03295 [Deltaproteobacteria bacterium]